MFDKLGKAHRLDTREHSLIILTVQTLLEMSGNRLAGAQTDQLAAPQF